MKDDLKKQGAGSTGIGIDEAGRGDTIGEAGMLTGGAYPHTALCVRDSELVRMSRSAFELITAKSPAAAARLLESMARKLTRAPGRNRLRPELVTICLYPADTLAIGGPGGRGPAAHAMAVIAELLHAQLEHFGPTLVLDRASTAGRFADGTVSRLGTLFYRSKLTGWCVAASLCAAEREMHEKPPRGGCVPVRCFDARPRSDSLPSHTRARAPARVLSQDRAAGGGLPVHPAARRGRAQPVERGAWRDDKAPPLLFSSSDVSKNPI